MNLNLNVSISISLSLDRTEKDQDRKVWSLNFWSTTLVNMANFTRYKEAVVKQRAAVIMKTRTLIKQLGCLWYWEPIKMKLRDKSTLRNQSFVRRQKYNWKILELKWKLYLFWCNVLEPSSNPTICLSKLVKTDNATAAGKQKSECICKLWFTLLQSFSNFFSHSLDSILA